MYIYHICHFVVVFSALYVFILHQPALIREEETTEFNFKISNISILKYHGHLALCLKSTQLFLFVFQP